MSAFTLPTTLDGWLTLLETRHAKPIDLGLERVGEVYRRLGIQLPGVKFVVAGTNGKGSTCAMLDAILRAAGYRVGLHTSPHLLRFNERIRIDGEELSDEALLPLFEQVELARGDVSLSYFEFTTLVMFLAFSREPLDAVVMEIGLGGRLDAVNLVDADCAIVTSVAIDHAQWLGNDRETIALEKAHIFRPDRPAICSDPQPPQSLVRHAEEIGADLWLLGRDYNYAGDRQQWAWTGRGTRRSGLAYPALRGMNQLLNASGVLAALQAVRGQLPVSAQDIRRGLSLVEMPGRFQVLPGQPTIILDVGHNPHAAGHLVANLGNMAYHPATYAVFGMLSDKDIDGVIAHLANHVDHWICCDLPGPRGTTARMLADHLHMAGIDDLVDRRKGIDRRCVPPHPTRGYVWRAGRRGRMIESSSLARFSRWRLPCPPCARICPPRPPRIDVAPEIPHRFRLCCRRLAGREEEGPPSLGGCDRPVSGGSRRRAHAARIRATYRPALAAHDGRGCGQLHPG